jgi:hypothetical protein
MSQTEYLKCACKECGNNIEFPASAARTTITCPHCGEWTELQAAEEKSKETVVRVGLLTIVGGVILLIAVLGCGVWLWQHQHKKVAGDESGATTPVKISTAPVVKPPPPVVIIPAQVTTQAVAQVTPKPPRAKSPDDLKVVGAVQLEKTKGSSLVYAVGTVKNDSEHDRYGVRIELDLFNSKGGRIGAAKDYKDYLGPNQDWQFRALIPDPKAVEAKVASVKEEQ